MKHNKKSPSQKIGIFSTKRDSEVYVSSSADNGRVFKVNFATDSCKRMLRKMKDYIDKHNLLYSSQYGFRKDQSTQDAILDIVNAIQSNMNQGLFSCGVFIDLKKAFDTVDHNILLDKLNHYGFRGVIKDWFPSYLNNRMQSTQIGPHISNKVNVSCGVVEASNVINVPKCNKGPKCNKSWS